MTTFGQIPSNDELITGSNVSLGGLSLKEIIGSAGVNDPAYLKVAERGAGANMSVDIAAGTCYIDQSDNTMRDSSTSATVNLAIASNSSGSTRIDLIVIEADLNPRVEQGTPGGGVPANPANSHVLAEVSVADGATSITNANITDRREYCGLFRRPRGHLGQDTDTTVNGITSRTTVVSAESGSITVGADRRIGIQTHAVSDTSDGSTHVRLWIREGSTLLQRLNLGAPGNTSTTDGGGSPYHRYIPGAGTYNFNLSVERTFGSGTVDCTGDIWVTDEGGLDKPTGGTGQ